MAQISEYPKLELVLKFTVNEEEARALDALAGYGHDAFIKHFYEFLGKHYMEKHEDGLRTFLKSIQSVVGVGLNRLDTARKIFNKG